MNTQAFNINNLVLTRLLPAAKPELQSGLKKSLAPLFSEHLSSPEWNSLFQQSILDLAAAGFVETAGRNRTELNAAGKKQALDFLGLDKPPARMRWEILKNAYLVSKALNLPMPDTADARKRIAGADGLRAAILRQAFDLPIADFPTLAQAKKALVWQQLGKLLNKSMDDLAGLPFTGKAAAILLNELLDPARQPAKVPALTGIVFQLTAKQISAKRTDPNELRLALLRGRIELDAPAVHTAYEFDPPGFAKQVMQAARGCKTGRFGDDKVFISHVWREFRVNYPQVPLDEASFKRCLVEANRRGLIRLCRADLVEAMDREDVSASETNFLYAVFHFIEI
ncbi:MAG: hypothetical protein GY862_16575 [Gammaproteobacteria bacterium]|nr:hypothetical protein [Gammaproteobacteria bacterium]